jgi:uncharacterized membrane protein
MRQSPILKISRLEGLTDGTFAIAMTILALDLHLPEGISISNLATYFFSTMFLKFLIYIGSFIILGTLWVAMNFQLGLIKHVNRPYLWTNIFYLMLICIVPFSANFLAHYPENQLSISFFAINIILANMMQYLIFRCAHKYDLNSELHTPVIHKAIIKRLWVAPIFDVAALIVAFWSTELAFLILVAPPIIYMFPGKIDQFNEQ